MLRCSIMAGEHPGVLKVTSLVSSGDGCRSRSERVSQRGNHTPPPARVAASVVVLDHIGRDVGLHRKRTEVVADQAA
jgi:hypothetical protein